MHHRDVVGMVAEVTWSDDVLVHDCCHFHCRHAVGHLHRCQLEGQVRGEGERRKGEEDRKEGTTTDQEGQERRDNQEGEGEEDGEKRKGDEQRKKRQGKQRNKDEGKKEGEEEEGEGERTGEEEEGGRRKKTLCQKTLCQKLTECFPELDLAGFQHD